MFKGTPNHVFFVNGQGLSEIHPNQCPSHKNTPHLSRIAFSEDQGALGFFFLSSTWEMIIWTVFHLRQFARVCAIFRPIQRPVVFTNTFHLLVWCLETVPWTYSPKWWCFDGDDFHATSWYNPSRIKQKQIQSVKNDHVIQSDLFIPWLEVTKYPWKGHLTSSESQKWWLDVTSRIARHPRCSTNPS